MRKEIPKDDEAPHALPQQRVTFTGEVGEDMFFSTARGFEVAVQRKGLHNFVIGAIKPKAKLTHNVNIRTQLGEYESMITTIKPKGDVVVVEASFYRYSDKVLISITEGDDNDMFVFFRDPENIKTLVMVTYVGILPDASQADLAKFFEQGNA